MFDVGMRGKQVLLTECRDNPRSNERVSVYEFANTSLVRVRRGTWHFWNPGSVGCSNP